MIKTVPMTDRQAELLGSAFVISERAKRELDLLLEGMAAGMEGKLQNADTDARVFTIEVPDETSV
jgi:hypothetical protein